MPLIRGSAGHGHDDLILKDLCTRISAGVATGADEVFIRKRKELPIALAKFARPSIAGRELTTKGELSRGQYVILLPYAEDGRLLRETELGPLGHHLATATIHDRLMKRTCVQRKPWYAFHETPPLPEILRPKILCKDIAQKPHFWIDRQGSFVPRHSVYYLVPRDPAIIDRLCAYLNSGNVAAWLSLHCQRAANSYLRLQSSILKRIPVPDDLQATDRTNLSWIRPQFAAVSRSLFEKAIQ
jgi:adenine-specific DNA-methyltransferase